MSRRRKILYGIAAGGLAVYFAAMKLATRQAQLEDELADALQVDVDAVDDGATVEVEVPEDK